MFLSGTLLALCAVVTLAPYGAELGFASVEKSPEELEIRAKDIVRQFGYSGSVADSAWFGRDEDYMKYVALHSPSTQWYRSLRTSKFGPMRYWYRQSPQLMIPRSVASSLVFHPDRSKVGSTAAIR